jgi:LPXTG-site transpeptidase (sortase) family protein
MPRIGLDNPAFAGRLRTNSRRSTYERRPVVSRGRMLGDVRPTGASATTKSIKKQSGPLAASILFRRSTPKATPIRQSKSKVLKRQLVAKQKLRFRRRRRSVRTMVMPALATILFVFGVGVGFMQLHTNEKVKAQVQTLAENTSADGDSGADNGVVSESKPSGDVSSHKVSPDAPRAITIKKLGVNARVVGLGLTANNALKAPNNIYDVGWYEGSVHPGERGAMIFDGHVHGPTTPGVFVGLKKLTAGDMISVERGDGKVFNYRVVKAQSYDKDSTDAMSAVFSSAEPGKPGLNMITCDGAYDEAGHYNKRLVVFAVQE